MKGEIEVGGGREGTKLEDEGQEKEKWNTFVSERVAGLAREVMYKFGENGVEQSGGFSWILADMVKEEVSKSQPQSLEDEKRITSSILRNLEIGLKAANTERNPDEILTARYDPKGKGKENYIQKEDLLVILKGLIGGDLLKLNVAGDYGSSPRIGMAIRRFSELTETPPQETIQQFQDLLQRTHGKLESDGKNRENYLDEGLEEWGFEWNGDKKSYTYQEKKVTSLHELRPDKF